MDLIVEAKEARLNQERDQKKHSEMKMQVKEEVELIKDQLHQQLKRQQVEFQYERERMELQINDLQQQNQEYRKQSEFYRKESEDLRKNRQNDQVHHIREIK